MVLLIAHRGLIDGPDFEKENQISTIEYAISKGYDVEIDVWYHNNEWYAGHNEPTIKINLSWLIYNHKNFWIHAKNIQTTYKLSMVGNNLNYFYHDNDPITLTSHGFLWTYVGNREITPKSILLLPEKSYIKLEDSLNENAYGICSDYVERLRDEI